MTPIFNEDQRRKADFILDSPVARLSALDGKEIRNLCCAWSFYSGKIEGNTYTYAETEALLNDGITSERRYEDAKMLKNLYNTFTAALRSISKEHNTEVIDEKLILRLHQSISSELVSDEDRGVYRHRAVRIGGTDYIPPKDFLEIQRSISDMLYTQDTIKDPLERAIFLHCNTAKTQPFIDGNKRVSRLIESIVLMNNDIIPVYSTSLPDMLSYKKAVISFYETGSYTEYADFFLDQQISRINELAPPRFQYRENGNGLSR